MAKGGKADTDFTKSVGAKATASAIDVRLKEKQAELIEYAKKAAEIETKRKKDQENYLKLKDEELKKILENKEATEEQKKESEKLYKLQKEALENQEKFVEETKKIGTQIEENNKKIEELQKLDKERTDEQNVQLKNLQEQTTELSAQKDTREKINTEVENTNGASTTALQNLKDQNKEALFLLKKFQTQNKRVRQQVSDQSSITAEVQRANAIAPQTIGYANELASMTQRNSESTALILEQLSEKVKLGEMDAVQAARIQKTVDDINGKEKSMTAEIIKQSALVSAGKTNREASAQAIKDQYEELQASIQSMSDATDEEKAIKEQKIESLKTMEKAADVAERQLQFQKGINNAVENFNVPLINDGLKAMKDILNADWNGLKVTMVALGAALGVAAVTYFDKLAGIQEKIKINYEIQSSQLDLEGKLLDLKNQEDFIAGRVGKKGFEQVGVGKQLLVVGGDKIKLSKQDLDLSKQSNELFSRQVEFSYNLYQNQQKLAALQGKTSIYNNNQNIELEKIWANINTQIQKANLEFNVASKTALFGKGIGSTKYAGDSLQLMGISAESLASDMAIVGKNMGNMPTAAVAEQMALVAKRSGTSTENVGNLVKSFTLMDGLTESTALNMVEGMRTMADQANIPLDNLMQEVADAQKSMLSYGIKNTKQLTKQVAYAQSMGVSFQKVAEAGKSMVMNYQDSIKSEMELSALLGEQVDLSEVRAAFAEGGPDAVENAMKALQAQGLNPEDMNQFQLEALQKSLGGQFDTGELQKMLKGGGKSISELQTSSAAEASAKTIEEKKTGRTTQQIGEAIIDTKKAEIDLKLDKAAADALTNSDAYIEQQKNQLEIQRREAELQFQQDATLKSMPEYVANAVKKAQLEQNRGIGEALMKGLGGVGGAIAGQIVGTLMAKSGKGEMGKVGGIFGSIKDKISGIFGKKGEGTVPPVTPPVTPSVTPSATPPVTPPVTPSVTTTTPGAAPAPVTAPTKAVAPTPGAAPSPPTVATEAAPASRTKEAKAKRVRARDNKGRFIKTSPGVTSVAPDLSEKNMDKSIKKQQKGVNKLQGIGAQLSSIGKGLGDFLKSIGKGAGQAIAGILGGIATGLKFFANPKVVMGAAGLAASITLIGAGIAGAAWLLNETLPALSTGLLGFNDINGKNLLAVGGGIAGLGIGLAAMGAGKVLMGVGNLVGGLFGETDIPLDKLRELSKEDINADRVSQNAKAIAAYGLAMSALGAGSAIGNLGNAIGGVFGAITEMMGQPNMAEQFKKMEEFSQFNINANKVENNAKATVAYGLAMAAMGTGSSIGNVLGLVGGLAEGITKFFGGPSMAEQFKRMEEFATYDIDGDKVVTNAKAAAAFAAAMGAVGLGSGVGGLGNLIGGLSQIITKFFGGPSMAEQFKRMEEFGTYDIDAKRVENNSIAAASYAKAMAVIGGGSALGNLGNAVGAIGEAITKLFGGPSMAEQFKRMEEFASYNIDANKVENNAKAVVAYSLAMGAIGGGSALGNMGNAVGAIYSSIAEFFGGPSLDEQFKNMQEFAGYNIDAKRVENNAKATAAYGLAMAAIGGGSALGNLGNAVGAIGEAITEFFGGPSLNDQFERMEEFAGYNIDAKRVENNAKATAAYALAMAAIGGGGAVSSFANTAAGIMDGLNKFFGGKSINQRITDMEEFGKKEISLDGIKRNSEAITYFTKAMTTLSTTSYSSLEGIADSLYDGISTFFGGGIEAYFARLKKFADLEINLESTKNNAEAFVAFSSVLSKYTGTNEGFSSLIGGITTFFGGGIEKEFDRLVRFAKLPINLESTKNNAEAFVAFASALSKYTGGGENGWSKLGSAITGFFTGEGGNDDLITQFKRFSELNISNADSVSNSINSIRTALSNFTTIDTAGISAKMQQFLNTMNNMFKGDLIKNVVNASNSFGNSLASNFAKFGIAVKQAAAGIQSFTIVIPFLTGINKVAKELNVDNFNKLIGVSNSIGSFISQVNTSQLNGISNTMVTLGVSFKSLGNMVVEFNKVLPLFYNITPAIESVNIQRLKEILETGPALQSFLGYIVGWKQELIQPISNGFISVSGSLDKFGGSVQKLFQYTPLMYAIGTAATSMNIPVIKEASSLGSMLSNFLDEISGWGDSEEILTIANGFLSVSSAMDKFAGSVTKIAVLAPIISTIGLAISELSKTFQKLENVKSLASYLEDIPWKSMALFAYATPGKTTTINFTKNNYTLGVKKEESPKKVSTAAAKTAEESDPVVKKLTEISSTNKKIVELTKAVVALSAAKFENRSEVTLKLDGKDIAFAVDKTKQNYKGQKTDTYGLNRV